MNSHQRYELIRPILKHEKTPKQVSEEKNVPLIKGDGKENYEKRNRKMGHHIIPDYTRL